MKLHMQHRATGTAFFNHWPQLEEIANLMAEKQKSQKKKAVQTSTW